MLFMFEYTTSFPNYGFGGRNSDGTKIAMHFIEVEGHWTWIMALHRLRISRIMFQLWMKLRSSLSSSASVKPTRTRRPPDFKTLLYSTKTGGAGRPWGSG